ncbi:MAG: hypothetical protein FJ028_09515 [Chloroflexi bacterium]|nr:hypothetical protein [Chloroflexota bacterium]
MRVAARTVRHITGVDVKHVEQGDREGHEDEGMWKAMRYEASSSRSTRVAASRATAVPLRPIATPMCASRSAGARGGQAHPRVHDRRAPVRDDDRVRVELGDLGVLIAHRADAGEPSSRAATFAFGAPR